MTTLPYLLTASLYLVLFYGCYSLLLRRNTFFGLNRLYLLVSVVLSLVLPLIQLPAETANALPVGTITLPAFTVGTPQAEATDNLTITQGLWLMYGLGALIMLIRLCLHLVAVFRLIRRGSAERRPEFILVRLPGNNTPSFSFGRHLVLNQTDSLTEPAALIRHEAAHIRQGHTADILFLEIVRIAFWFNPVLWFYKWALQEVHEFLADRAAVGQIISNTDTANQDAVLTQPIYAQQLVAYALDVPATALTTPFVSKSTLKQRIIMLQKPQTHRRALVGYALALPLAALLVMCTQPDRDQPITETAVASKQAQARKPVNIEGEIFTVVEHTPEFKGGMKALGAYLQNNLKYPAAARKANVQGRVFVQFVVTKTGEVTNVKVLKGIGFGADEEAIRVVQNMPRWEPATQNGQRVNVQFHLPINFQLEPSSTEKKLGVIAPPPPPPPPAPANDSSTLQDVQEFTINGKHSTKEDVTALSPNTIARVDVNEKSGIRTVSITTK